MPDLFLPRRLVRAGARVVCLWCGAGIPSAAAAQVPDTVIRLGTVHVELGRLELAGVPLLRSPLPVQVLTRADWAGSITLGSALDHVTGVSTADVMGTAVQPDVSMRGFSVSPVIGLPQGLSVFVDGVRVNEPDASQVYFNLIPLYAAERVEVLRGPSGAFGKNALGGSVNVVTQAGADGVRGRASADSHGGIDADVLGSTGVAGVQLLAAGRVAQGSGWRDAASHQLLQLFTRATHRGRAGEVWLSHTLARDSVLQAGSLPRSWLRSRDSVPDRWADAPDTRAINFTGGDLFQPTMQMLVAGGRRVLGGGPALAARLYHRRNDVRQFNANFTEPDTRIATATRTTGAMAQLSTRAGAWQLAAGAEYAFADVGILIYELPNENFTDIEPAGEQTEDVGTREHDAALYVQARVEPTARFALTGAARYDYVDLPFRDHLDPSNDGDNVFHQLTGSLAADWEVRERVVLFGGWARGFRAPTILELACADPDDPCPLPYELGADPPLDPVVADTWQAGIRHLGARGTAEAVAYWTEVRDDIFNVQAPASRAGYFTNLPRTRRQGIELTTELVPRDWLVVGGNVALNRATFRTSATLSAPYLDDDDDDEPAEPGEELPPPRVQAGSHLPMLPRITAGAYTRIHAGAWRGTARLQHTGVQWLRGDEDNSQPSDRVPAATLLSLSLACRTPIGTVRVGADNVLDTVHYRYGVLALNQLNPEHRVEPFLTPGAPRRLFIELEYR